MPIKIKAAHWQKSGNSNQQQQQQHQVKKSAWNLHVCISPPSTTHVQSKRRLVLLETKSICKNHTSPLLPYYIRSTKATRRAAGYCSQTARLAASVWKIHARCTPPPKRNSLHRSHQKQRKTEKSSFRNSGGQPIVLLLIFLALTHDSGPVCFPYYPVLFTLYVF